VANKHCRGRGRNEEVAHDRSFLYRPRKTVWSGSGAFWWPLLMRAIGKAVKWGAVIAAVRRLF